MALPSVDVRIVQGSRMILRYHDIDVTEDTRFRDLLKAGLEKSDVVSEEEISKVLEDPVVITLHPTAERTQRTAIHVSSLNKTVQSRCRSENQRCVLFKLFIPDAASSRKGKKKIMFGSPEFRKLRTRHLPEKRAGSSVRHICFNRVVETMESQQLGFSAGEHLKDRRRFNTKSKQGSTKKKKTSGSGYAFVLNLSELLSYYQMHCGKLTTGTRASTKTYKLPEFFKGDFALPSPKVKPADPLSTEKMRDLLTAARDSIHGMWARDREFKAFITEIHSFLDRLCLFCDRRQQHNEQVNRMRRSVEPVPGQDGCVFFPKFCAAASSSGHGQINRCLREMKYFAPLFVDDKFVLPRGVRPDEMETKMWEHRKK